MASKSSKIAVTLQPSLKQKLREYGKENQIKNFSGVILSILDEYFGGGAPAAAPSDASSADVWSAIRTLTDRLDALEGGAATTKAKTKSASKPVVTKTKPKAPTRRAGTRTKSTAAKSVTKRATAKSTAKSATKSTGKTASTTKATAKKTKAAKPTKKSTATKTAKAKTTRARKVSSPKAAPTKKAPARRTGRKSTKATKADWMSTREAFNMYGGKLSWSRFSKLTPEELKERFNLDSDLSRKVRGSRFNQWLKPGK